MIDFKKILIKILEKIKDMGGVAPSSLSLGAYSTGGYLTASGSQIVFTIPTGRVFPEDTTISRITFNLVARIGGNGINGRYIVKSAASGSSGASIDTSASSTLYNGDDVQKTIPASTISVTLQGRTNINVNMNCSSISSNFFTGDSTTALNNRPVGLNVGSIVVYF